MSPIQASQKHNYTTAVENTLSKTNSNNENKSLFKVGDKVRINRTRAFFCDGTHRYGVPEPFSMCEK